MITIQIRHNITKKSINISTGLDYSGSQVPDKPLLQLVFLTAQVFHVPNTFFVTQPVEGEVNSVTNTTMNIWLNDGVYWQ